ncbi:MAG: AAA family ATPase [Clostridia bacterium]|nr:AAA family ATPase [Clostridia bacterium]
MPAANHPDYNEELERCRYTLQYIEKSLENTITRKERVDNDIDKVKRHFSSESSQNYIEMLVNTTIQGSLDLKLKNLLTARSKPYFARIDFREGNKSAPEKLYIGKMSLMRDEDQEVIIVDWRAPIANLYYEGRLGEANYQCPDGDISGELSLKRQFSIDEGALHEIFDIDITTNDEFLQSYLGASADNRLKEIVSTIQSEQNKIIRADMWKPLIVQGAAGSGKTTIALHRIAYLIYTFEKSFHPENFMIIAPNRLFLNYISDVLPELGVEKVKQTTFEEFAMELLGKRFKLREANEKLTAFVNNNADEEQVRRNQLIKRSSELKTSMVFKEIVDDYISYVESRFIPKENFKIGSKVLFTHKEINDLFLNQYKMWAIVQRIDEIKKSLTNRLKLRKDAIVNQIYSDCDARVMELKMTMEDSEERQKLIIEAIDQQDEMVKKIESYSKKAVSEYIKKISKFSPFEYYMDLMSDKETFDRIVGDRVDKELRDFTREYTLETLKSGYVEIEDLAPITYLKYCIYGMDEKIPVKHIVIDEAQDFSVFQLYVLKKIVKDSSFTILGDLCQGIHSYRGIRDWNDLIKNVFDDRRSEFLTLEQSYRTTVEIMDAANKVIDRIKDRNLIKAKPVIRHGEKVRVFKKGSTKEIAADIAEKILQLRNDGFKSTAVICKTMSDCKNMLSYLKKDFDDIYVMTGKEAVYKTGPVIVPSYLSKGLEFDVVLIANAGKSEYSEDELDIKLLYVCMTRPLHKLYVYYHGELSPLLEGIADE